jgi:prophage DNA circulation protein
MAAPLLPSTPRPFTFAGRQLYEVVTQYSGTTAYRSASHKFGKRDGGLEEDMGRDQRQLEARLKFIGSDCGAKYQDFISFIDANRTGLLVHPTAGKWTAFCKGPGYQVNFTQATNEIEVPVLFVESELDANIATDTPDVATAAQAVTSQQLAYQISTATHVYALGSSQTQSPAALNSIAASLATVTTATSPVAVARSVVNQALGAASTITAALASIQTASDTLNQDVNALVTAANAALSGTAVSTGFPDSISTLVGIVQNDAATLENALVAAAYTPASPAYAVADVEILVDTCLTLQDSINATQPPTALYTVPQLINLLALAQQLIVKYSLSYDALTYGSTIMGLNRITNPAAIPAGTVLTVPTA